MRILSLNTDAFLEVFPSAIECGTLVAEYTANDSDILLQVSCPHSIDMFLSYTSVLDSPIAVFVKEKHVIGWVVVSYTDEYDNMCQHLLDDY